MSRHKRVALVTGLVVAMMAVHAGATPVYRGLCRLVQPWGAAFQARRFGDEWYIRHETAAGYTIMQHPDDLSWRYAEPDGGGNLRPGPLVVGDDDPIDAGLPLHLSPSTEAIQAVRASRLPGRTVTSSKPVSATSGARLSGWGTLGPKATGPLTGTGKVLVLLADFPDDLAHDNHTYPKEDFEKLYFSEGEVATGSLHEYYQEISYGQFGISGAVTDWTMLPRSYSYYVGLNSGLSGSFPKNSQGLVVDLAREVDHLVDFSRFDGDGDGEVDALVVVFEGSASGSPVQLYPHSWTLNSYAITLDGVKINNYALINETDLDGNLEPIGTLAHEYGHVLGTPDMYDYDLGSKSTYDENNYPVQDWCIMGTGNYGRSAAGLRSAGPAHMSGFIRWYWLGWMEPVDINTDGSYQIHEAGTWSDAVPMLYRIPIGGSATEYFLIENRHQAAAARFDKYNQDGSVRDSGLIIYHIDETMIEEPEGAFFNDGTPRREHYGAWVLDPGENLGAYPWLYKYDAAYSAEDGQTVAGPATSPATTDGYGGPTGITISDISSSGTVMTFSVAFDAAGAESGEANVTVGTNAGLYKAGDTHQVSLAVDQTREGKVDVYLGLMLPDGEVLTVGGDGAFYASGQVLPLLTGWEVENLSAFVFDAWTIPAGLAEGTYTWVFALTIAGRAPEPGAYRGVDTAPWSYR